MPRYETLHLGEPVWARMDGYPWWPGRIVTVDEVVIDNAAAIPKVGPESHLVEFFNDNQRFAAMHKDDLRSFLNPRYKAMNANYSGTYLEDLNTAIRDCRKYMEEKSMKYKPMPKPRASAAAQSRKVVPKREPKSEHSDIESEASAEEQRRSRKRRQADSVGASQDKRKGDKEANTSSKKKRKRKTPDTEEETPRKYDKKGEGQKEEPLEILPDQARESKRRKSEPTLVDKNDMDIKRNDGKRKEARREEKPEMAMEKRATSGNWKNADERKAKEEPVAVNTQLEKKRLNVKPSSTEDKGELRGSDMDPHPEKYIGKQGEAETETQRKRAYSRASGEPSNRGEGSPSIGAHLSSESAQLGNVYSALSRQQLVELVNMLEKEVRTYRVKFQHLQVRMGLTKNLVQTRDEFFNLCAPGFRAVSDMATVCEKQQKAKKVVSAADTHKMEADAIDKLDVILRSFVTREVLQNDLKRVAKRAMKLTSRILTHSVKVARVLREIVVQWFDMALAESVSPVGGEGEPRMAAKTQDRGTTGPADSDEMQGVVDTSTGRKGTERGMEERTARQAKKTGIDTDDDLQDKRKSTEDADMTAGVKADVDMVDVEEQEGQNENKEENKVKKAEENRKEQAGKEKKGSVEDGVSIRAKEEVHMSGGAFKDGGLNGELKEEELDGGSWEQGKLHGGTTGDAEVSGAARKESEVSNVVKREEEVNDVERKEGDINDPERKDSEVSSGAVRDGERSSVVKKEAEVKDISDEKPGEKVKKVLPSERHERRVREFTRERCLDTFKKVLHPLKGSQVKNVVVDDEKLEELAEELERAVEPTRNEDMHRYFEKSRKVLKMLTGSSQSRNEVLKCIIAKDSIKTFVLRCLTNAFVKDRENNGN